MNKLYVIILCALLAACGGSSSPTPVPIPRPAPVVPAPGSLATIDATTVSWNLWFSPGMPAQILFGNGYPFPGSDGLHYVSYPFGNLLGYSSITLTIEVTGTGNLVPVDTTDIAPCKVTLFFGQQDVTLAHLRFWSDVHLNLTPGIQTVTVSLDPSVWHTVDGTKDPAAFAAQIAGPVNVGYTFGGQNFDGHGVYTPAAGSTGFILHSYVVNP